VTSDDAPIVAVFNARAWTNHRLMVPAGALDPSLCRAASTIRGPLMKIAYPERCQMTPESSMRVSVPAR
jgi:hypothetical protein